MMQHPDSGSENMGLQSSKGTFGTIMSRYKQVRDFTEGLCESLVPEDYIVQSMPDVSPTKWHLGHTTWFFETFLLMQQSPGYRVFNPHYSYIFNSYYTTVGDRHCRINRGQLSRPTVAEVGQYRRHVDEHMLNWLVGLDDAQLRELGPVIELGLNHEQQHQELMLTDIKHVFWVNPMRPVFRGLPALVDTGTSFPIEWIKFSEGVQWLGHEGAGFSYDNERPRHRVFLEPFELGSRLVTNGEYKKFIEDSGYSRANLWLSAGWSKMMQEEWEAPLYWIKQDGQWWHHTLSGLRPVIDDEPVCHVSYFEADAYARWAGARLPTEAEWEIASGPLPIAGNFADSGVFHPRPVHNAKDSLTQMFGDGWEWTRSQYTAYPGYSPPAGALGEYNGKFMCDQFVLRGGSCATPNGHVRHTYRNFFPADTRWQFSGVRLARDPAHS